MVKIEIPENAKEIIESADVFEDETVENFRLVARAFNINDNNCKSSVLFMAWWNLGCPNKIVVGDGWIVIDVKCSVTEEEVNFFDSFFSFPKYYYTVKFEGIRADGIKRNLFHSIDYYHYERWLEWTAS